MDSICFVLGAGASVDSGLFTYRGSQGLYRDTKIVEKILTHKTFKENPQAVWDLLNPQFQVMKQVTVGPTYKFLERLCKEYPQSFVITQNIDRLAKNLPVPVIELHGRYDEVICPSCQTVTLLHNGIICEKCQVLGGPNILMFDESLSEEKFQEVYNLLERKPHMVIVIGTSLQFLYLKSFIVELKATGSKIIHINSDPSYGDRLWRNEKHICKTALQGLQECFPNITY